MYDFYEFNYSSNIFKDISVHELITLVYAFYSVHAGSVHFMTSAQEDLLLKLN